MRRTALLVALATLGTQARAGDDPAPSTVTVTGKKEVVARQLDRTVHDVSNLTRAANGSAQDVLQALPEISVTADGQIAVKGNPQVTVLIDGKTAAMLSGSSEERAVALQTMSGADIASVDVITNPAAAFAGNGGAIINVVLKRNRKRGAHAQVQGSGTDQGLWQAGASGDATRGAISVHGNLAYRHDGTLKLRASGSDWTNPVTGQTGQAKQTSAVFVRRIVDSAAFGIDAAPGDADTLSLSARYNARRSHPLFDVLNEERTGAAATVYHRISDGPNTQADASASLAWSHQDGGTALKASVQHSTTHALVDKSWRDVFDEPGRASAYSHGASRSARRLDQAAIDWTRADDHGQWGMGVDVQRKGDDLSNLQAAIEPSTGAETPDPVTTNGYLVTATTSAAYLTRKLLLGQWEALLGARAERTTLRVRAGQDGAPNGRWQALDPSLHLRYAASGDVDVTLSHRRSLQLPDPRDLNPFTTYVDAQNRSRGNPGLGPQRVNAWETGVDVRAAHVSSNLGAFYRTSRDTVFDAHGIAGNVIVTSKQNGGRARSAGVTGSLDWAPDAALRAGIDGGAYRVLLATPAAAGSIEQQRISGYLNARASYRAGTDDIALDAHFQSAGIVPLGRTGATSSVNLTWKRRLNKLLALTVNANDLLDGSRRTYSTNAGTIRQAGVDHFVARRIYVGFVRKFE